MIHQMDRRNEWFLLSAISARLTTKFELAFGLTQENAFLKMFHFKFNRKSTGSSKNSARNF